MGSETKNGYSPLDRLTDWMEHLDDASLDELREIRLALGDDVEASEREFLSRLREKLPHLGSGEQKQDFQMVGRAQISGLLAEAKARGLNNFQFADAAELSITLITKLDRRLIKFPTIPHEVIQDLAAILQQSTEAISEYLQGGPQLPAGAEFKAEQTPRVTELEDFFDAVQRDTTISENRRQRLLTKKATK